MSHWSAQQHEWLEAMGFDVLRLASATPDESTHPPGPGTPSPAAAFDSTGSATARLQRAVLHALRSCPEPAARLATLDIDVAALRGNATAKRALWPRLRAMRAASR